MKYKSTKNKRAYRNILFGVKVAFAMNCDIRFLTLTTSDLIADCVDFNDKTLYEHFRCLKGRIKRLKPIHLVKDGYMSYDEAVYFYGRNNLNKVMEFEYFKVKTNEGNGVIHCIYRGSYLPYNWLTDNWMDLHLSWNVSISKVGKNEHDSKEVASYVVNQYISNQNCRYVRFSQSQDWIFKGFAEYWKIVIYNNKDWKNQYINEYGCWTAPINWDGVYKDWDNILMSCAGKDSLYLYLGIKTLDGFFDLGLC